MNAVELTRKRQVGANELVQQGASLSGSGLIPFVPRTIPRQLVRFTKRDLPPFAKLQCLKSVFYCWQSLFATVETVNIPIETFWRIPLVVMATAAASKSWACFRPFLEFAFPQMNISPIFRPRIIHGWLSSFLATFSSKKHYLYH